MSWTLFLLLFPGIPDQSRLPLPHDHFTNYHQAHKAAHQAAKPLLIIMNPGSQTEFVSLESVRKTKERRELLKGYVVVMIDTTTPHGKIVHNAYSKPQLPHVVVLDKRQGYQIFKTSEQLYGERWNTILKTYRNGERVIPRRVSYCPYCQ